MCARRSWRDPAGASPVRVGRSGRSVASVARARRRRRPRSVHSDPVGCVWSPEMVDVAEAEALSIVEGNMCGIVMRDAVAPPGSETTSCRKGSRRNLGGLRAARSRVERSRAAPGSPDGRTPAMYGREESDGCVVPGKPSNKAGRDRRRRRWREGARSRRGRGVHHIPDAVPGSCAAALLVHAPTLSVRHHPRQEPDAGKPQVRICAGGAGRPASLPRQFNSQFRHARRPELSIMSP